MPFINLNSEDIDFSRDDFDVVIAGAGAAGILLAVKLSEKGKRVLLLESGHFAEDEGQQSLNTVEQSGKELTTAVWGRRRAIGGTTTVWGGQSLPFSPLDFSHRPWVANSGWPLSYEELFPYYQPANRFMKIDEWDYDGDILRLLNLDKPGFNPEQVRYHFSKWAPEPNFRKLYNEELAGKVVLLYNAVLTRIELEDSGKADRVRVTNMHDRSFVIPVRTLILAAGGIETNRVLLSNNHQLPSGIGNRSGWLGKCFMEHPCIEVGEIKTEDPYRLQYYFNTHIARKRRYSIRLSLAEQYQESARLLNGSASLMFAYANEEFDPYLEIKNFIRAKRLSQLKGFLLHTRAYGLGARAYLFDKFIYKHKARARLVMMLEQEPVEESHIALSDQKDRFGTQMARINWRLSKKTWDTVIDFTALLGHELKRLSYGELTPHPHIVAGNGDWESCLTDVNHHMGGTRMSDLPENGVVNRNLQVWGHDNLFLCSSSVFPTGSHSNPTLTLLALSLRLVDFLTATHNKF